MESGWYLGGGVDYVLLKMSPFDVIVGADYQHVELNAARHASSADAFNPAGVNGRDIKASNDMARVKLTLKFNPWAH